MYVIRSPGMDDPERPHNGPPCEQKRVWMVYKVSLTLVFLKIISISYEKPENVHHSNFQQKYLSCQNSMDSIVHYNN